MRQSSKEDRPDKPDGVDKVQNGSMVQNEQDMKRLGNEMDAMKTNKELEEDGLVPDPKQE
ncbi:hypothetical protein IDH44_06895 [Paenibacillus sp. IB182496]|uniref:Multidrug ABC transporter ATPase n=1 Tax=Paenibacillus sabuli TaxID=2772509 RepID=A0A927BSF4_9BACL|nr:hypothetical protein [Paenibacillus sabuli]MBD2844910.1 hypothetical protein [Paenibacillus sabuli]